MLRLKQDRTTYCYDWVSREDKKYWNVNNNIDDQVSVCPTSVNLTCKFKKLHIH